MTVSMSHDPLEAGQVARAGGLRSKTGSAAEIAPMQPDEGVVASSAARGSLPPAGPSAAGDSASTAAAAQAMTTGRGASTADKLARGIVAVGAMSAAAISRSATAVGAAITNYADNVLNTTPPLSEPLTVAKSYSSRLSLVRSVTQPAAYAADLLAGYAGELLYWLLRAAMAVYQQLAAMKVLPQITAGGKADEAGVPVNPVRSGLPMTSDDLAAFKLVGAALLVAYVEVYDALEEAAQALFRIASGAGQRYMAHRYGGEAADVGQLALNIAADGLAVTLGWFRLMGRAFFSKTASDAARSYLQQTLPDLHLD